MKKLISTFGWLLVVVLIASCASEPEAPAAEDMSAVQTEVEKTEEKVEDGIDAAGKSAEEIATLGLKNTASEARSRALSVKAQNAAKEIFSSAQSYYDKGEEALKSMNFVSSMQNYESSIPLFNESHDEALAAKERALAALENAKKAIEEADAVVNAENEEESEETATEE